MGDFLSKSTRSFSDYQRTNKSIFHPILGEFLLVQNHATGDVIIQKKVHVNQLEGANQTLLRTNLLLSHPNIIRFEGYEKNTSSEYFTYFENFECTLKQEIQNRALSNTRFTEKEIISLLRNISSTLAHLQGNRIVHGQIRSETIVKVGSEYKLLNMILFGNYKSTYQQALEEMRKTQIRHLSPQLQDALFNKIVDPVHEGYKDDVYALGVVILDVMTLSLDSAMPVTEKLKQATQIYSKSLISLINKMMENIMSLRLDCIACNTVIENMYIQKEGLYSSRISQRDSFISGYRNNDPEKFRMSTGVSMNDLKKYSPVYRAENTLAEQNFSPARHVRSRTTLNDGSYTESPLVVTSEMGSELRKRRDNSLATDSVLAQSYALQGSNIHSPERLSYGAVSQSQTLSGKILRPISSIPRTRAQPWESGYTPYRASQASPLIESDKKSYHRAGPDPTNLTNLSTRNLSSVIKNDPLICSILASSDKFAHQRPTTGSNTYQLRTDHSAVLERLKSSGVSTSTYRMSTPMTQTHTTISSNIQSYQQPLYGANTPPKLSFNKNFYVDTSKNEEFQAHKRSPSLPMNRVLDNGYLEPMQLDNSPIYTGYSQIEQDEKDLGHTARRKGSAAGNLVYSMNLNSSRVHF